MARDNIALYTRALADVLDAYDALAAKTGTTEEAPEIFMARLLVPPLYRDVRRLQRERERERERTAKGASDQGEERHGHEDHAAQERQPDH